MNRLILIGNGSDLAHKLKTSYCDFIKYYISKSLNALDKQDSFEDPLLKIAPHYNNFKLQMCADSIPETALRDLNTLKTHGYFTVEIKSKLLSDTLDRAASVNWVDLENDYFEQLVALKDPRGFNFEGVKALNDEFDYLKTQLQKYLITLERDSKSLFHFDYRDLFCEPINGNEIVEKGSIESEPKKILILNFNYTKTLEKYKDACPREYGVEINYIHGQLESEVNPIIFGFGDEFNQQYKDFEGLRNNELLRHIKSFAYFKTSNYHNLMRFIDADDFQVYIFGHSLGLSDRTMLRQIFEHRTCISIKIFYHKIDKEHDDYRNKTFDISSHFTNKATMRLKIVPYNLCVPMPQIAPK